MPRQLYSEGIASDAAYVGSLVRDFRDPAYASFVPVVSLCLGPYFSLFVHESYRKLQASDPSSAALLSTDAEAIVTRSRHSLKLFEDTQRGVNGQIMYFRDDLLPAHARFFQDSVRLSLLRFLAKDLGLFSYDGRLFATSHSANFHLGIEPGELLEMTGAERQAIYEQYGRYFKHIGGRIDSTEPTFISRVDPRHFNQQVQDVRSSEYYDAIFDGPGDPALSAVLTVFRGMMNLVDLIVTQDGRPGDLDYTVFKIRFLTLYQIIGSLQALRDERPSLSSRSVGFIDKITNTAEAQLIMVRAAKPFRNMLMHYNLNSHVDTTRVDLSDPLFGLVPIYFSSYDTSSFVSTVDRCITETAVAMDEWAGV